MKIFAALYEDTQQGWVWLQDPAFPPRSIVKIKNLENGKVIYCEALQIDSNFLATYNQYPRLKICIPQKTLVINYWYRAALGGISTQSDIQLNIKPCNSCWGKFRACTQHPQIVVRVAVWLGFISVISGLLSIIFSAVSLWDCGA
ncbi:hypothetical protein ABHF54_00120 [Nitrosomonas europaea]|uniref:hypothetical protein n=1 Tax=Nitrosomonas europaea TaxID=915 RepID=UPI0032669E57